jgi:hypothetical protein
VEIRPVLARLLEIFKQENIVLTVDNKKQLALLVRNYFPDIRKTINEIQRCCISGEFIPVLKKEESVSSGIADMINKKTSIWDIRKFVIANETSFNNDYHFLMRNMFDLFVTENNTSKVMYVVDAMYKHAIVADPEVNFTGLLINLAKV